MSHPVMSLDEPPATESIGNYDLIAKIAEGGMGAVYQARHRTTGQIVAIKIVPPATAKNTTLIRRFEREFNAAHEIDHINVVKAIEFCGGGPSPFLVMEYVDGESLGQKIEREGKISEEEAKRLIVQVCQGLHRAHKHNLIHRDIKPDNVLLTKDGTAKITDLGLVKGINDEDLNLTRTGRGLGTPHFMAPEQFRDAKSAGYRCDVYSVGATMYMLVTGVMPFDGSGPLDCWMKKIRNDFQPPKDLVPELSDRTNWAILRAMSADPEKRPATCREFVEDLIGTSTKPMAAAGASSDALDLWYLVYQDEIGQSHTVKGTTDGIRRALKDGLLGDAHNIVASKTKTGAFISLERVPEFRDLIVAPAPLPPKSAQPTPVNRATPPLVNRPAPPRPAIGPQDETAPYMPAAEIDTPDYDLPHFQIETRGNRIDWLLVLQWVMWLALVVLGVTTAVATYIQVFQR